MELHSSREQEEGDMHDDRMPHDDDDDGGDCIDGLSSSTKLVVVLMVMGASSLTWIYFLKIGFSLTSQFDQPCGVE